MKSFQKLQEFQTALLEDTKEKMSVAFEAMIADMREKFEKMWAEKSFQGEILEAIQEDDSVLLFDKEDYLAQTIQNVVDSKMEDKAWENY